MVETRLVTQSDGFKETELGPIPVDWEVVRLSDVVSLSSKPRDLNLDSFETIPFIPMELIPDNGTLINNYVPKSKIGSGTYCERGDILLAKITPSFENGKQGIVNGIPGNFAYATTEVYPLKAIPDKLDQMFLFHFLKHPTVRSDIAGKMEGSTGRQRVPKAVVENYPIPLPPLDEQRRIAHVLNTIQREIAAQDKLITAAREVKRSLMQRLFTYGSGAEPAPTKETEIGEAPEHWEVVQLKEVTTELRHRNNKLVFGRNDILSVSNAIGFFPSDRLLGKDFSKYKIVQHRQFAYNPMRLNIGSIAIRSEHEPGLVSPDYIVFKCKEDILLPEYCNQFRYINMWWSQIYQSGQGSIRIRYYYRHIGEFFIPLPPLPEQWEIAHILITIDRKIAAEEQRKSALQALFESMLHQLMTGQVRVKDQG